MRTDVEYKRSSIVYIIIGTIIIAIIALILIFKNRGTKINLDENNICNENIYDGSVKNLTNLETNVEYTVTNNTATEAGEYTVNLKANSGYIFNDRKKEKNVVCVIQKLPATLNISKEKIAINKNGKANFTIDTTIEGTINLQPANNIVKIKEGQEIRKTLDKKTINLEYLSQGTTTLSITFIPDNKNYETVTKNIDINCTEKNQVSIPTNSICNKLTYTGKNQKVVSKTDYDGYTLFGQLEGTIAGNYRIEAALKKGYIWNDGTTSNKIVTCTIYSPINFKLKVDSSKCTAGEKTYIYIDRDEKVASWRENNVVSIQNNKGITTLTKKENCDPKTYVGLNNKITNEPTNCIYPGRYEVNCLTPGTDNISFNMDNGSVLKTAITVEKGETAKLVVNNNSYDGINCTLGKELLITIKGYKDGKNSSVIKRTYSTDNSSIATVSEPASLSGNKTTSWDSVTLSIKCIKKGTTNLVIKTTNGTTKKFPIKYIG